MADFWLMADDKMKSGPSLVNADCNKLEVGWGGRKARQEDGP